MCSEEPSSGPADPTDLGRMIDGLQVPVGPIAAAAEPPQLVPVIDPPFSIGRPHEVFEYSVRMGVHFTDLEQADDALAKGGGWMTVRSSGLTLAVRGTQHAMDRELEYGVPWDALSEVRNRLAKRGWFDACIGGGKHGRRVRIHVLSGDTAALAAMLDALPEEARNPRCPACGGAVLGNACQACGRRLSRQLRKRGMVMFLAGAGWLGASLAIWLAMLRWSTFVIVHRGLPFVMALGGGLMLIGLWQMLTGRRG